MSTDNLDCGEQIRLKVYPATILIYASIIAQAYITYDGK